MRSQRSLTHVLARQWALYTLALFSGFFVVCVLLLYILEDSFINRRLHDVARSLTPIDSRAQASVVLPENLVRYAEHEVPAEIARTLFDVKEYGIKEFRLANNRYVHALKYRSSDGYGGVLVYDVSDEMRVNITLYRGLPFVLFAAFLLAIVAYLLAYRFASRTGRQAQKLLAELGANTDIASILELGKAQSILEFSQLAQLSAGAIEQQKATLQREQQTLEFMAHELRTPLQSLRTNIALLLQDKSNENAWMRLQRASARLVRATYSILWLSEHAATDIHATCNISRILHELCVEFSPLLSLHEQTLVIRQKPTSQHLQELSQEELNWPMPAEIAETIVANLLLNAIQHGQNGEIAIQVEASSFTITNPCINSIPSAEKSVNSLGSFGMGIQIVERLLNHVHWQLLYTQTDFTHTAKILAIAPSSGH